MRPRAVIPEKHGRGGKQLREHQFQQQDFRAPIQDRLIERQTDEADQINERQLMMPGKASAALKNMAHAEHVIRQGGQNEAAGADQQVIPADQFREDEKKSDVD